MRGVKYLSSQISFNLFVLTSLKNKKTVLKLLTQPSPTREGYNQLHYLFNNDCSKLLAEITYK